VVAQSSGWQNTGLGALGGLDGFSSIKKIEGGEAETGEKTRAVVEQPDARKARFRGGVRFDVGDAEFRSIGITAFTASYVLTVTGSA
jgi:hypothetical protein